MTKGKTPKEIRMLTNIIKGFIPEEAWIKSENTAFSVVSSPSFYLLNQMALYHFNSRISRRLL
ncbi:hypothetical protein BDM02DRAFT_3189826 [Thelephora ganbajun]|uniref:Uncharacterized protein n=1 Tax=Thelephora ganbajun TaxID=370292 RepID=A0ACB6Z6C9_THEGA|nr:hypothetical protein BDM02DRAFT_3189826 [Thelephora ganbajun]